MRIWKGKEMEGRYIGATTMFVETDVITLKNILIIRYLLCKHPDVTNIYLGAGRVDIKLNNYEERFFFNALLKMCSARHLVTTIETSNLSALLGNKKIADSILRYGVQLVHRVDADIQAEQIMPLIVHKIDDTKKVILSTFTPSYVTDLNTLRGGLYTNVDKIIYEK